MPDGIFRISDTQIEVPLSNSTNKPIRISKQEIKYQHIKILLEQTETVYTLTSEDLSNRLKLLRENIRIDRIEQKFRKEVEKIAITHLYG